MSTSRLRFSVWNAEDLPDAIELWGNPEVTKFIVADGQMLEEQVKQRLQKEIETYREFKVQYWPVYLKDTNKNIGCCGLRPYDLKNNIYEMGIHLKQDYWGMGFAAEACSKVIEYAFNILKVESLFAGHNPKNVGSAQLLKKLGFEFTHDEFYPPTGLYHPSYLMTKDQYKMRNKL